MILSVKRYDWVLLCMVRAVVEIGEQYHLTIYAAIQRELRRQLIPVLRRDSVSASGEMNKWMERLVTECREQLSLVLPFEQHERDFLEGVLEHGEIIPELLTGDEDLAVRIKQHPQLLWKIKHVREHKGLLRG